MSVDLVPLQKVASEAGGTLAVPVRAIYLSGRGASGELHLVALLDLTDGQIGDQHGWHVLPPFGFPGSVGEVAISWFVAPFGWWRRASAAGSDRVAAWTLLWEEA